jgi:hypothetical protein
VLAKLRPHLSYANVMASIAVFVALGGTSVAAVSLKKNSVGSTQIKNSSLTGTDVKNSSLTTSDVKNRSLLAKDFKAGQLPAGPQGARGLTGTQGATGLKGDTGGPGEAVAYATVDSGGNLISGTSKNFTQANIDTDTVTGVVCLTGLPFTVHSAMTSNQPAFNGGEQDVIVGAYVATSGDVSQGDCVGQVLVRTFDVSSAALADRAFTIWFED